MKMRVSILQNLEKRFSPDDARVIAQAIEEETSPSRLVTNESLKLQLSELENRLFTKVAALGLTATGLIISVVFFLFSNLKK
jgi:hypothetical protein